MSSLALWPFPALAAEKDKEIIKSAAKALHELQETLRSVPSRTMLSGRFRIVSLEFYLDFPERTAGRSWLVKVARVRKRSWRPGELAT